ncbi:cell wall-binding repeat-containing protein [Herbiconiux sp. P15]|uniref:cell wall-binding repeat-containing protein n=1 Tax=Herbiconiux liukaitaii TaxID=3342799 RepID=UPI0035B9BEA1
MALNRRFSAATATASALAIALAAGAFATGAAAAPLSAQTAKVEPGQAGPVVSTTYSSSDETLTLDTGEQLAFEPIDRTGITTIGVNTSETGQTLDGLGGSLESSSVYNIAQLSSENRDAVMAALFDIETGNGYDLMRLAFGCPDFCAEDFYTYDDMPAGEADPTLANFSIQKDIDGQIISVAKQALAINPDVEFFASAWSPPAWMKDNQSLNNGGTVLPEYYPVLAQYYRLAIAAYAEQGIPIKALTVANEPQVVPDYPSSSWSWEQERDFIPFLRAELDAGGFDTEIWIQDDNWWTTSQFANILADPVVGPMVDGVAVHDYDDGDVTQAAALVDQYPDITVRLTERSYYDVKGVDRMIQLFRNDVSSWTYWLTFLDEDGLPNEGPLDGDSFPQQIGAPHGDLDSWYLDRDYYLYGQFSRFLERGAVRVESDYGSTGSVTNVVFQNPDGTLVAIVDNQTDYSQQFRLVTPDGQVTDTLPAASVGTYTWTPEREALDRGAWTATASTQDWGSSQMLDNDEGTAWRNFSAQDPGQSITVDTGAVQPIAQITLDSGDIENGASANDWPRGYTVSTSIDGTTWSEPVAAGRGTKRFTNIEFPTTDARYLRVELTAVAAASYWTVAEVFAFTGPPAPPTVDRIGGADRYEVSVNTSKAGFPDGSETAYVVSGEVFADALSAAPAAARDDAPILLTTASGLPDGVLEELVRLSPSSIVIVGGPRSVGPAVESELEEIAETTRIGGADRFEASRNVAEYAFADGAATAVLATGATFPDALSAGAAIDGVGPVILVNGTAPTLDEATKKVLSEAGVSTTVIVGGTNSVSTGIEADAATIGGVVRLAGADRYEASRSINAHFFTQADRVLIATGEKFPDALSGSALAPRWSAPLFTVPGSCVPAETLAQIQALGAEKVTLLGGESTLSQSVATLDECV